MTQQSITLTVYGRESTGKGPARRVRMKDMIPGIVYGPKMKQPLPVSFRPNDIITAYKTAGKTTLVTLETADGAPSELKGTKVLFKAIEKHPVKSKLIHVDLHQIDLTKKLRVIVPVHFTGRAKGQNDGGILNVSVRQVEIRCAANDIPSHLDIDISNVGLNEGLHVSDLEKIYPNIEFIYENDFTLMTVTEVTEEISNPAAAAAAPAEGAAAPAAGAPTAGASAAPAAGAPAAGAKK
jgi:large subunit ribosomal protein L25